MALHRLTSISVGVPNVAATAEYYRDFGLTPVGETSDGGHRFATRDGGEQLLITYAPRRQLLSMGVGAHDQIGRASCRERVLMPV